MVFNSSKKPFPDITYYPDIFKRWYEDTAKTRFANPTYMSSGGQKAILNCISNAKGVNRQKRWEKVSKLADEGIFIDSFADLHQKRNVGNVIPLCTLRCYTSL